MIKEDIVFNIKYRIMALKSLSPKEQEANKGNLWELEDLLAMIENDHIEDEPQELDDGEQDMLDEECGKYIEKHFGEPWDGCVPIGCFELIQMALHFYKKGKVVKES